MDANTDNAELDAGIARGLEHPFPAPPAPGMAVAVAPDVYWLRMPLPFRLNHINLWLLDLGDSWCLVDSGYGTDAIRGAWQEVFSGLLDGRPVSRILITHYHPDHIGLAGWLSARWGVPIEITPGEWRAARDAFAGTTSTPEDRAQFFRAHGLDDERNTALRARGNLYHHGVPSLPDAASHYADGDDIEIGAMRWRIMVGRGHSPEHACLYCPDRGVLISGDLILPRITPNISVRYFDPDGDPLGRFLDSLARFHTLPAETLVLPSHGLPFTGLHRRLDQLSQHHDERLALVIKACATPHCAADLIPHLFDRALEAREISFAMGEILSHINHLLNRGSLTATKGDDGVWRYRATSKT